jgi:glycosyltransferase involved in cell wall biosynthesis
MFSSTIIPTVRRDSLARAVNSVLSQSFDKGDFEVIVVNDSGGPLGWQDWQSSNRVQMIQTNRRERSVARNAGAAIAQGQYLHFLDDDDWLLPDALCHLWQLSQNKPAAWLYGSSQLVERNGSKLIQLQHEIQGNCFLQAMAGEWIPLQSSLIEAKLFHRLGGFSALITGPEDIDLFRRICLYGNVAGTSGLVASIERGEAGSTTNYNQHSEMSRLAREHILDDPLAFHRMKETATSGYWLGRMSRIYFTSAIWNLQHKRLAIAASRLASGLAVIVLSHFRIFSGGFWNALLKPYQSPTFARGLLLSRRKFAK